MVMPRMSCTALLGCVPLIVGAGILLKYVLVGTVEAAG